MRPGVLERDAEQISHFGITIVDRRSVFGTGHIVFVNMLKKIIDMLDTPVEPRNRTSPTEDAFFLTTS